ncbi:PAN domain-containing protein [Novosphingobium sp. B 225]|uniref:PAN domain-containing protein n=1 Tax=Novosphingobium sp. B 225 TaxID=1961849 RepID=UPI0015952282|nr:PAN domain-containing protein [Novosphingobium sp. B 225]
MPAQFCRLAAAALALCAASLALPLAAQQSPKLPRLDAPTIRLAPKAELMGELTLALTEQQRFDLTGQVEGRLRPVPGRYLFRHVASGLCMEASRNTPLILTPFIQLAPCAPTSTAQRFAILPTTRLNSVRQSGGGFPWACADLAQGVVFGPPRIDWHLCTTIYGQAYELHKFVPSQTPGSVTIRINSGPVEAECWTVRDGRGVAGNDIVGQRCTGGPEQEFMLDWQVQIDPGAFRTLLERERWFAAADGHKWGGKGMGVDLIGPALKTFATAADDGEECLRTCLGDTSCRSWTWQAAGYPRGGTAPQCTLKGAGVTPVNRGDAARWLVISGIPRPA